MVDEERIQFLRKLVNEYVAACYGYQDNPTQDAENTYFYADVNLHSVGPLDFKQLVEALDEARSLACDVALFQAFPDGHWICSVCGAIGETKSAVEHEDDCKIGLWRNAKDGNHEHC